MLKDIVPFLLPPLSQVVADISVHAEKFSTITIHAKRWQELFHPQAVW